MKVWYGSFVQLTHANTSAGTSNSSSEYQYNYAVNSSVKSIVVNSCKKQYTIKSLYEL